MEVYECSNKTCKKQVLATQLLYTRAGDKLIKKCPYCNSRTLKLVKRVHVMKKGTVF